MILIHCNFASAEGASEENFEDFEIFALENTRNVRKDIRTASIKYFVPKRKMPIKSFPPSPPAH